MWEFHGGDHWGLGWGWWVAGPFMMAIFWGAVIWFAVQLFRNPSASSSREDPMEIARRRLASGEIDEAEFERIARRLDVHANGSQNLDGN